MSFLILCSISRCISFPNCEQAEANLAALPGGADSPRGRWLSVVSAHSEVASARVPGVSAMTRVDDADANDRLGNSNDRLGNEKLARLFGRALGELNLGSFEKARATLEEVPLDYDFLK